MICHIIINMKHLFYMISYKLPKSTMYNVDVDL